MLTDRTEYTKLQVYHVWCFHFHRTQIWRHKNDLPCCLGNNCLGSVCWQRPLAVVSSPNHVPVNGKQKPKFDAFSFRHFFNNLCRGNISTNPEPEVGILFEISWRRHKLKRVIFQFSGVTSPYTVFFLLIMTSRSPNISHKGIFKQKTWCMHIPYLA